MYWVFEYVSVNHSLKYSIDDDRLKNKNCFVGSSSKWNKCHFLYFFLKLQTFINKLIRFAKNLLGLRKNKNN